MISVGDRFPKFNLTATISNNAADAFVDINQESYENKWIVMFFWPKDFTFVCPTEIKAFEDLYESFAERDAQILGASTDSEFVHLAWRQNNPMLSNLSFPMLSDIKRELSQSLDIIDSKAGVAKRATYIIDPAGIVRFHMVTDLNVGRNPEEVLRVLDALQTEALTPCNWKKGEETLKVA